MESSLFSILNNSFHVIVVKKLLYLLICHCVSFYTPPRVINLHSQLNFLH